ncbi:uncharacterized protein BDCG_07338 [Blastomyces dermatitidis ER-3]|uniref:Mitochondrial fission process protein 1 n=1 Tax=Ajellomyces dermatitidis (strain ER-3 / ATCC MYA-2586) TaxID=559297 RepID=A0ABP2F5A9_AJEDR|nr:uncharacterized protein BDCG_07338 [Blastomyces dermatitidis ER-3]EEQ92218.2 hypothetical protein BDCG_07338 [Blastomyces dermatitidis ER-3]
MAWGIRKKAHTDDNHDGTTNKASHSQNLELRRRKLNPELQKLLDREEELLDQLYDGYSVDTIDTKYRYAAYTNRIRTILLSAHRYVAYTSDIGESFRPVAHPWLVRSAYGISWTYILGDVANEGYKAYLRNRRVLAPACDAYRNATGQVSEDMEVAAMAGRKLQQEETLNSTASKTHPLPWPDPEEDTLMPWQTTKIPLVEDYRSVMAERAVFQALASVGLPALTIHSVVKYSGRAFRGAKTTMIRTWLPIGLGLAVVPFLPYVFDKPVEHGVQWAFHSAFRVIEGGQAVPHPAEDNSQTTSVILSNLEQYRERKKQQEGIRKRDQGKSEEVS